MMKKQWMAAVLAVLCLCLGACGKQKQEKPETSGTDPVHIPSSAEETVDHGTTGTTEKPETPQVRWTYRY